MKTSPPTSPAAHIYAEQLFQKGHGYPLWFPEHATSFEGVRIGDIGYVRGGSFQCVFNATLPANHPANSNGVPTSFAPLEYDATSLTHAKEAYLPGRAVSSQTMKSIDRSAWAGMNSPMSPIGGESLISYKCVSHKGAILLLNEGGATQETLLPNSNFPAYMLEHYDSWYKLAKEQEHDIEPEDLVMVKGTVKASDWTVAAFYDKSKHRSFKVEARGIPYVGAGLSFTNSKVSTEYRTTRSDGGETPDSTTPPHLKPQCVFLSRYMMRRRSNSGSWKKRGLGGLTLKSVFDRDSKVGRTSPCDRVRTEDDGGIDQSVGEKCGPRRKAKKESGDEKVWDPLHVLLNYILKNSKCEVAIGSDDDVAKLLELGYEISQDQFKKQLRIFKPHIEVSKKGVGYLVHGTNNNIPSAPNRDIVRKTERTTSTSFPPSQGFNSGDRGIYSEATYLDTLCTSGYHFVKWGWKRMQQTKPLSRLSKCKTTDGDVGGGALVGKI